MWDHANNVSDVSVVRVSEYLSIVTMMWASWKVMWSCEHNINIMWVLCDSQWLHNSIVNEQWYYTLLIRWPFIQEVVMWLFTLPSSTRLVSMTMVAEFCSQTIRQKSSTVWSRGPCVTMYSLIFWYPCNNPIMVCCHAPYTRKPKCYAMLSHAIMTHCNEVRIDVVGTLHTFNGSKHYSAVVNYETEH